MTKRADEGSSMLNLVAAQPTSSSKKDTPASPMTMDVRVLTTGGGSIERRMCLSSDAASSRLKTSMPRRARCRRKY